MFPDLLNDILSSEIYHLAKFDVLTQIPSFSKDCTRLFMQNVPVIIIPFFNLHFEWRKLEEEFEKIANPGKRNSFPGEIKCFS